jgi:hypothetical protein
LYLGHNIKTGKEMAKKKRKLQFKPRRKLDMGATFNYKRESSKEQQEQRELVLLDNKLRRVFPNEKERQEYIHNFIAALDEELGEENV